MTVPTWSELMERLYEASKPHYAKPGDVFEGWDASITTGYEHMNEAAQKTYRISVVTKGGVWLEGYDSEQQARGLLQVVARLGKDAVGTLYLKTHDYAAGTDEIAIVLWSEVAAIQIRPANKYQLHFVAGIPYDVDGRDTDHA
jgi:hypothetical protein